MVDARKDTDGARPQSPPLPNGIAAIPRLFWYALSLCAVLLSIGTSLIMVRAGSMQLQYGSVSLKLDAMRAQIVAQGGAAAQELERQRVEYNDRVKALDAAYATMNSQRAELAEAIRTANEKLKAEASIPSVNPPKWVLKPLTNPDLQPIPVDRLDKVRNDLAAIQALTIPEPNMLAP